MTDWSGALARAFQNHLNLSGSSGSSGSGDENRNVIRCLSEQPVGTSAHGPVVPVVPPASSLPDRNHWNHSPNRVVPRRLRQNGKVDQDINGCGTTGTTGTTENELICAIENFEERAALVEYGANVPRDWAEGFARLALASPPDGISVETWWAIIDDAGRLLDAAERRGGDR